jgi:ABC-2 type transport system ATP-binding protein
MEYAIIADNLTKRFGSFTAVDKVSFSIEKGKIFGFLGPNGSGKSTTIRMLCGVISPSSGGGSVLGYDIIHDVEKVKHSIGYMSQKFGLYDDLTVEENLNFYGGIYGLDSERLKERSKSLIKLADLEGKVKACEAIIGWLQAETGFRLCPDPQPQAFDT